MLPSLTLIVALAHAPHPSPAPRATPYVVPMASCAAMMQRAGLTTISRDNPFRYAESTGKLLTSAMDGHLSDADLGGKTAAQIENAMSTRGFAELYGWGPAPAYPAGVIGCIARLP